MGYSTHSNALARMKEKLDELLANPGQEIAWESSDAHKFAYHMREALNVAERTQHEKYKELKKQYTFKVRGNVVFATPKDTSLFEVRMLQKPVPKNNFLNISDVNTVQGVVGACIMHSEKTELYFPEAEFDADALGKLYRYTSTNNWFIVYSLQNGLKLTRVQEENTWAPQ